MRQLVLVEAAVSEDNGFGGGDADTGESHVFHLALAPPKGGQKRVDLVHEV